MPAPTAHGRSSARNWLARAGLTGAIATLLLAAGHHIALAAPAAPTASSAPHEPSAADKETARSLVMLGDDKMAAGDYPAALKAYQGADAIMGVPTTGIEVGRAQIALGLLVEATDTLLRVARYPAAPDEPEAFAKARADAERIAEPIPARIPTLTVEIYGIEPGTAFEVELDGEPITTATVGLPRKVNPGKHQVVGKSPGFAPVKNVVTISEREQRVMRLVFGAPANAAAGPSSAAEAAWYVGIAIAGVGVVVGAVTGGISLSVAGDVKDQCTGDVCPASVQDDADRSTALGHVSTVSFIVAGAGAVTSLIAGLLWLEEPAADDGDAAPGAASRVRVVPELGVGTLGLRGWF